MTRLFLVCPARPPVIQRRAFEVLHFDRAAHYIALAWPNGAKFDDINFHVDMAKRCGYILTAEVPPEFRR